MSVKVKRDADNKFYIYIDWNAWIDDQALESPDGPNLTVDITGVSWSIPAALTEEAETPASDVGGITYFVGSGGVNGTDYPMTATITYSASELSATDLTQDQSLTLVLEQQ